METNGKRKHDASGAQGSSLKRSKGGNQGKWMTPSHKAKLAAIKGRTLEVGDMGFWVTCQRMKEMKAADEILSICEEYGQRLFGIASDAADDAAEDDEPEDIEVAIEKEIATMESANKTKNSVFDLIRMNVDCVLFMRTRAPVDPLKLVREICKDAAVANDRKLLRSRFINKLTPITLTGKATEKGLEDVAKKILSDHFRMADDETDTENDGENEAYSYAIRPTLRAHSSLKRTEVIDKVANMISKRHKVDLKNPDKVIIIEIFQTFCGMSVVGKDWEAMKRYNIHELYSAALKSAADPGESEEAKEGEGDGQA
ncbi:hypothetical protein F5B22DRAFT_602004 [Xylaria bambusicola]|uniref:uncharacterized protein n=1 Tax=Xylaria bambusicola TaxID=326684 RepID=UPI0020082405|nr:uncharacterized protein F5B22DRAFT_602004 [Xylaria bambusicola]KAI0517709.1 hypothetical protein F5B22DRAFT_602004 [Xylaria bambusicola]